MISAAHLQNRKIARTVAHLKYTQPDLRSQSYEERPTSSARAPVSRDFLSLCRATPSELASMLAEDGLIVDLRGVLCPRMACIDKLRERFSSDSKLGMRRSSDRRGRNIKLATVWHKCVFCGNKQSIALHNPIYAGFLGPGGYGVSVATLAMWNAVEGISQTSTARQLNINEKTCRRFHDRAHLIMAVRR